MKTTKMLGGMLLVAGCTAMLVASARMAAAAGPDLQATAQTLTGQCANIQQGDLVVISGTPRDVELLDNIAVQVRKVGAFPLISIGSDPLTRRLIDEVPAKFDAQPREFELKLANLVSAWISIESTENPSLLAGVAPERIAARAKTEQSVMDALLKRNVRQVGLGNGLYPTAATAKQYGMPQDELAKLFWAAVNTDYAELQSTGERIRSVLASGKEVRITHSNGTDLKFKIEGRPVFVSDGVISSEDVAKGGPATQVWLPAGEVYASPVTGTAEGKVVVDRHFFQGAEITGLTLTFKGGKLTDMTAKSGLELLKAHYAAADANKDVFAFVDIGINADLKIPTGSKLLSWIPAGMVTIGVGNNTWAGGSNATSFSLSGFLPGSTLQVDGKPLVENGVLKM